jgi:hypothetical protein
LYSPFASIAPDAPDASLLNALGQVLGACDDPRVDEILKQLLGQGILGLVIVALVLDRRSLIADRKTLEAKIDGLVERHRTEVDAFHERMGGKAENWATHLAELAQKGQENDLKTNALLEALVRTITAIQAAVAGRKRGGGSEP